MRAELIRWAARLLIACGLAVAASAHAGAATVRRVSLEQRRLALRVRVRTARGGWVDQSMLLTLAWTVRQGHAPFLLLLHGRPIGASARKRMGLVEFPAAQAYFASLGYVVVVPTRIGYGMTGGPDVEDTGPCGHKDYSRGMRPVVSESRQLLHWLRLHEPGFDWGRGLVFGDSFGGIGALAIAAAHVRGVLGVVNLSGGDGGDSVQRLDNPCSPWTMASTVASYGRRDTIPSLWMYSRNDYFWGSVWPHRWFDAFVDAGGHGRFVELPADKNNGHFIFTRNLPAWQPAFRAFSARLGLP